ncbi:MAG: hypothetical protein JXA28_15330 [Bacteroidetes bacterium]|nr:hypothetical protein [Bacteroidota bacterium]
MRSIILTILFATGLLLASCDHGLDPGEALGEPGFSGTITVRGSWPPQDSVRQLRVVAFRKYPSADVLSEVLSGNAVYTDELPYGETTIPYTLQDPSYNGVFDYIAVAQNYGPDLFTQWRAVGVYTITGDVESPSPVDLGSGRFVEGVDIVVDFVNLPPQPF